MGGLLHCFFNPKYLVFIQHIADLKVGQLNSHSNEILESGSTYPI